MSVEYARACRYCRRRDAAAAAASARACLPARASSTVKRPCRAPVRPRPDARAVRRFRRSFPRSRAHFLRSFSSSLYIIFTIFFILKHLAVFVEVFRRRRFGNSIDGFYSGAVRKDKIVFFVFYLRKTR